MAGKCPDRDAAHRQAGDDHASASDAVGESPDERTYRECGHRLRREQPAELRGGQSNDVTSVKRKEGAQGPVEDELSGVGDTRHQNQAMAQDSRRPALNAGQRALVSRAGTRRRPRAEDQWRRKPDDAGRHECQVESTRGDQVSGQDRSQWLDPHPAPSHRRQPGAPRGSGARSDTVADATGPKIAVALPCTNAEREQRGQRRRPEVGEGHQREHQGPGEQQWSASQHVGERAGRHLDENARHGRRAGDDPDDRWAGSEFASEQREEWRAADRITAVSDEPGGAQARQSARRDGRLAVRRQSRRAEI